MKFKILVQGGNLLVNLEAGMQRVGFYTTRYVEESNLEKAKEGIEKAVYKELGTWDIVQNERNDAVWLKFDEIEELNSEMELPKSEKISIYLESAN